MIKPEVLPKVIFYTRSEPDRFRFTFSRNLERSMGVDRIETYSKGTLSKIDIYKEVVPIF